MTKLHKTTKEVKAALFSSLIVTSILAILSIVIMFFFSFPLGIAMFVVTLIWVMSTIMIQVKLQARYTQELMLKIAGKDFYEFCTCKSCTAVRGKKQTYNQCENKKCKKFGLFHPDEICIEQRGIITRRV